MGFFDAIIDEDKTAVTATATQSSVATTGSSGSKKDDQDGSFLIIDDSVTASDIPDTAVSLFDETPANETVETPAETGISFFSETDSAVGASDETVAVETASISDEVATPATSEGFDSFFTAPATNEVLSVEEVATETTAETNDSALSFAGPEVVEDSVAALSFVSEESTVAPAKVVTDKRDPNEILARALTDLDLLLTEHASLAEAKDREIEEYNAQIAEAKEIAKRAIDAAKESSKLALEERKKIESEITRVKGMKEIFASQLAK